MFLSATESRGYEESKGWAFQSGQAGRLQSENLAAQSEGSEAGAFESVDAGGGIEVAHDDDFGFLQTTEEASDGSSGRGCDCVVQEGWAAISDAD